MTAPLIEFPLITRIHHMVKSEYLLLVFLPPYVYRTTIRLRSPQYYLKYLIHVGFPVRVHIFLQPGSHPDYYCEFLFGWAAAGSLHTFLSLSGSHIFWYIQIGCYYIYIKDQMLCDGAIGIFVNLEISRENERLACDDGFMKIEFYSL